MHNAVDCSVNLGKSKSFNQFHNLISLFISDFVVTTMAERFSYRNLELRLDFPFNCTRRLSGESSRRKWSNEPADF